MTNIPPGGGKPASTPPSKGKGRPEESKNSTGKQFELPGKKEKVEEREEKKKGLLDIAGEKLSVQERQASLGQNLKTEAAGAEKSTAVEAKAQVSQVGQLIQKMVASMRIGEIEGKNLLTAQLKASAEVPQAFSGSSLSLSYEANGLSIHFDHFMTPQQENNAITLVEKHKDQLEQMIQALHSKNIQVVGLTIGNHQVNLPQIQPLPPPFQATPPSGAETQQQQRERQDQDEKDDQDRR